jgi:hypothetical protein
MSKLSCELADPSYPNFGSLQAQIVTVFLAAGWTVLEPDDAGWVRQYTKGEYKIDVGEMRIIGFGSAEGYRPRIVHYKENGMYYKTLTKMEVGPSNLPDYLARIAKNPERFDLFLQLRFEY